MRLEVYVHKSQLNVEVLKVDGQNTGRAGLANKGGIVAEILINGKTKISFLTAHLEAHEGNTKYQIRCKSIADILDGTKSHKELPDISCTSHFSFVMGDLNFRSELPNCDTIDEEEHKNIVNEYVRTKNWDKLNEIDELGRALRNKDCLVGFQTLFCNFPPTFKVHREHGYEYNDKRRPSYTDRILWKTGHGLEKNIQPLIYEPIDDFTSSDHKPIRSAFTVQMNDIAQFRPKLIRVKESSSSGLGAGRRTSQKLRQSVLFTVGKDNSPNIAQKERLHLFVSDLQCSIDTDRKQVSTRNHNNVNSDLNTYVCFISDPGEILRLLPKRSMKYKFLKMVGMHNKNKISSSDDNKVTSKGWPRTSIQENTNNPNWSNEEIHFVIKTHTEDGNPIELTGAMMHITVFDSETSTPIGSFAFNLVNMIKLCKPTLGSSRVMQSGRNLLNSGMGDAYSSESKTRNMINFFNRTSGVIEQQNNNIEDPVVSVQIDEAITLNGCETGRISCRLEGWWMNEGMANAIGHFHSKVVDTQKERAPQKKQSMFFGKKNKEPQNDNDHEEVFR